MAWFQSLLLSGQANICRTSWRFKHGCSDQCAFPLWLCTLHAIATRLGCKGKLPSEQVDAAIPRQMHTHAPLCQASLCIRLGMPFCAFAQTQTSIDCASDLRRKPALPAIPPIILHTAIPFSCLNLGPTRGIQTTTEGKSPNQTQLRSKYEGLLRTLTPKYTHRLGQARLQRCRLELRGERYLHLNKLSESRLGRLLWASFQLVRWLHYTPKVWHSADSLRQIMASPATFDQTHAGTAGF